MLNASDAVATLPKVVTYIDPVVAEKMASGKMNTSADVVLANIASAIRRGYPQMRTQAVNATRVCLVGSGPSLNDTADELRQLLWEGATLVTLNGAYHWCIERNLRPQTQIVMDARATNARFVQPDVPKCNYVLASQCAPEVWDAVAGRPHVWIYHAVVKGDGDASKLLDAYYQGNWIGVGGGTTVATRAIGLLRMSGYVRFDLFGVDCCWKDAEHHALPQPENVNDRRMIVDYGIEGEPETQRRFFATPWMLKQYEDFMTLLAVNGRHFQFAVHGDGLLAYSMRALGGELTVTEE